MSDTVKVSDNAGSFGGPWLDALIDAAREREPSHGLVLVPLIALKTSVEFIMNYRNRLYAPHPDLADFTCLRCGKSVQPGAHTCLPQKPGLRVNCAHCGTIIDGKPFLVEQEVSFCRIQCAEEYGTVPSYRPQTPGEEMPRWVQERVTEAQNVQLPDGKSMAIIALAGDRSRLLTALEEANRKVAGWHRGFMQSAVEINTLKNAAVLQKEELEQKTKRIGELENYHRNCLLSIEQLEARLKRAPKSPTSGA